MAACISSMCQVALPQNAAAIRHGSSWLSAYALSQEDLDLLCHNFRGAQGSVSGVAGFGSLAQGGLAALQLLGHQIGCFLGLVAQVLQVPQPLSLGSLPAQQQAEAEEPVRDKARQPCSCAATW